MFRRRFNKEIIDILNEGCFLEADIQFEKKEKNIFGVSKGSSFVTRNTKEEIDILKNVSLSNKPFWCILYTLSKTSMKIPVKCIMEVSDDNKENFKLLFLKHKDNPIYPGSFSLNPENILNIFVINDNKIQINLKVKEIKI